MYDNGSWEGLSAEAVLTGHISQIAKFSRKRSPYLSLTGYNGELLRTFGSSKMQDNS
jgi:hypothetical protein